MLTIYMFNIIKVISVMNNGIQNRIHNLIKPYVINLYTIMYLDNDLKIYFCPFVPKVVRFAIVEQKCSIYNLILNFDPTKYSNEENSFLERIVIKNGIISRFLDRNIEFETNEYRSIKGEFVFMNRKNMSYIIKKYFTSFALSADQLCMVLRQPKGTPISIIDESFEEMIFKDSAIIIQ
jgi:hypothetical protein